MPAMQIHIAHTHVDRLVQAETATTSSLRIVKEITSQIHRVGLQSILSENSPERVESWRQNIDVFRSGILANWSHIVSHYPLVLAPYRSAADTLVFEDRETEDNFDLRFIASLEFDVVQFLDPRVPLAKLLQQGSQLGEYEAPITPMRPREEAWGGDADADGAYRRLYQETSRRLCLPALLRSCRTTLAGFVADESLRGSLPFGRVREEQLLYVPHNLHKLRLWPGSLCAALSDSPINASRPPRSSRTLPSAWHVCTSSASFYTGLAEFASVPRKAPSRMGRLRVRPAVL
ncbi:hypothetical protein FA95DRAFT_1595142 [Auriscalpium vulgare]|uniref:Uncharacterized protein n=1 Tax=Auriscalpium vulgare TaxID=40419 RepID=A0ACB8RXG2_9AGAM|nr:hypothetical protein FA95DRAFT_1595142 [Auriscalpium vulgare]